MLNNTNYTCPSYDSGRFKVCFFNMVQNSKIQEKIVFWGLFIDIYTNKKGHTTIVFTSEVLSGIFIMHSQIKQASHRK